MNVLEEQVEAVIEELVPVLRESTVPLCTPQVIEIGCNTAGA